MRVTRTTLLAAAVLVASATAPSFGEPQAPGSAQAAAPPQGTPPKPAAARIADVAWIAGAWLGGEGPVIFEEHWTRPAGGTMLAVARTLKQDRMVAFEFLLIVERDGGLVYIAQPNGRPPTEFKATSVGPEAATFENPAHDFPKTIRYSKRPDGSLEARVSAGARAQTFVFKRAPS
jgi:hypothetical protein